MLSNLKESTLLRIKLKLGIIEVAGFTVCFLKIGKKKSVLF